jgi:tRNA-splicing ligase RtcB
LADGKSYPLKELSRTQQEFIVYSCNERGKIVAAKGTAKLTRRDAELLKVVLDNGEEIKCTFDHQFMLRDGTYQEARDLKPGASLMPFYSKVDRDGYTLIQQPYSERWQKAHWIIARSGLLGKVPSFETCGAEVKSPIGLHNHRKNQHYYNHKVVEAIALTERQDVYCLTVPQYGNFALSAGVFVHNCGMNAIKTPFVADQLEGKLKKIRLAIEAAIPVGFNENKEVEKVVTNWQGWADFKELHPGVQDLKGKAMRQMGSLGGGNHFLEVCVDTENQVWLMLHSGSRNIGNMLAQCHISTAKDLAKMTNTYLPDPDLAYFVARSPKFDAYWRDLQWAQEYARVNRDVMMARFKRIVEKHLAGGKATKPLHHPWLDGGKIFHR